jgi:hypothetical protein
MIIFILQSNDRGPTVLALVLVYSLQHAAATHPGMQVHSLAALQAPLPSHWKLGSSHKSAQHQTQGSIRGVINVWVLKLVSTLIRLPRW